MRISRANLGTIFIASMLVVLVAAAILSRREQGHQRGRIHTIERLVLPCVDRPHGKACAKQTQAFVQRLTPVQARAIVRKAGVGWLLVRLLAPRGGGLFGSPPSAGGGQPGGQGAPGPQGSPGQPGQPGSPGDAIPPAAKGILHTVCKQAPPMICHSVLGALAP